MSNPQEPLMPAVIKMNHIQLAVRAYTCVVCGYTTSNMFLEYPPLQGFDNLQKICTLEATRCPECATLIHNV